MQKVTKEKVREIESKLRGVEKTLHDIKELCTDLEKDIEDPMYG